ncbi:MAG TPA: class F sortase [Sporichthyaceae bacterium]
MTPETHPAGRRRPGWVHGLLTAGLLSVGTAGVLSLPLAFPQPRLVAMRDIASSSGSAAPVLAPVNLAGPAPTALALPFGDGITASIDPVGVWPEGDLAIPDDPNRLGWWAGSAAPAAGTGTVVIDGHVDSERYGEGFFVNLRRLQPGDTVALTDAAGTHTEWAVTEVGEYPSANLADTGVFAQQATPRLALITCGGVFDRATHRYLYNLVVYAVPAPGPGVD